MAEYLKSQSQIVLFKSETTYGVDATPTGANAVILSNVTVNPVLDKVTRNNITGMMGSSGAITVGQHVEIDFDLELSASGTAGVAPAYDAVLLATGHAKVITAGASVVYSPVDSLFGSATIYWRNGGVQYAVTGCRGSSELILDYGKVPTLKCKLVGIWNDPLSGQAPPTGISYSAYKTPLGVNKANSTFSFFSQAVEMSTLSFNTGVKAEYVGVLGAESVDITGRDGSVKTKFRTNDVQLVSMIMNAKNDAFGSALFTHGNTAGNKVSISAPNIQIKSSPSLSWDKELAFLEVDAAIVPTSRNNDYTITFS